MKQQKCTVVKHSEKIVMDRNLKNCPNRNYQSDGFYQPKTIQKPSITYRHQKQNRFSKMKVGTEKITTNVNHVSAERNCNP